jgi:hypothetical protein
MRIARINCAHDDAVVAQFRVTGRGREAGQVYSARPPVHARNSLCTKAFDGRRRRRQSAVSHRMQMLRPRPGRPRGKSHAVALGKPRHVGLIHRHRRNTQAARGQ